MSTTSSTVSSSYPRKRKVTLALEVEILDADKDSYVFADPEMDNPTLQIGFIADLFDLLNFEASLGVEKINGFTHAAVTKVLQSGL